MKRSLKLLMSALAALVVPALGWSAGESISINAKGSAGTISGEATSGLVPVQNQNWNEVNWARSTKSLLGLKDNIGVTTSAAAVIATGGSWSLSAGGGMDLIAARTTALGAMGDGYYDANWNIQLKSVPYSTYDVILYMCTDNDGKVWSDVKVTKDGTDTYYAYTGSETDDYAVVRASAGTWGSTNSLTSDTETAAYGKTVMWIKNLSGNITIDTGTHDPNRGGLCGLQIVNTGDVLTSTDFTATVEGVKSLSAFGWDRQSFVYGAVTITGSGTGAELELDDNLAGASLTVTGDPVKFSGGKNIEFALTNINTDTDVSAISASLGTVTISEGKTLSVQSPDVYTALTQNGILRYAGGEAFTGFNLDNMAQNNKTTILDKTIASVTSSERGDGSLSVNNDRTITIGENADITVATRFAMADNWNASPVVNLNGGKLTVEGDGVANNTTSGSAVLLGHWPGEPKFNLNKGEFSVEKGAVMLGWSGNPTLTVGTPLDDIHVAGSAVLSAKGVIGHNAWGQNADGSLVINPSGLVKVGSVGIDFSSMHKPNATVKLAGGEIQAVDTATIKMYNQSGFSVDADSTITVDSEKTLTVTTSVNAANEVKIVKKGLGTLDLTKATLSEKLRYDVQEGVIVMKQDQVAAVNLAADGLLIVKASSYEALDLSEKVTLTEGKNVTFVLPNGKEVSGTGAILPKQDFYTYKATATGDNKWTTVANWSWNGVAVEAAPANVINAPVVFDLPEGTTFEVDVDNASIADIFVKEYELIFTGKPLTLGTLVTPQKVIVRNTITLNSPGTEVEPTEIANAIEVDNGGKLITKGYLNCSAANTIVSGGTLEVASGVTQWRAGDRTIDGTLTVAKGATFKNVTNDALDYDTNGVVVNVYGTLDMGSNRWTVFADNNTLNLYAGATVTGVGQDRNGALDIWEKASTTPAINVYKDGESAGEVTISATTRFRSDKTVISIEEGMTLTVSSSNNNLDSHKGGIKVTGAGTLKLTGENSHEGGVEIVAGATLHAASPAALGDDGDITIEGTLKIVSSNSINQPTHSAWGRMKGTGTVEFASGSWCGITSISPDLSIVNNNDNPEGGVVTFRDVNNFDQDTTIGTLSGNGWFRSDLGEKARSLIIVQNANSIFSGYFKSNGGQYFMNVLVKGAEGAEEKTLTLSGASVYEGNVNGLSIDATGSVNLTGSWAGNVTNNGVLAGTGSITGTLTLAAGATLDATAGALTVSGDITLGETLNVKLANAPTAEASVQILTKTGLAAGDVSGVALSVVVGEAAADTESYKLVTTTAGYAVALDITVPDKVGETELEDAAKAALLAIAKDKGTSIKEVVPAKGKTADDVNAALQLFTGIVDVDEEGTATVDWHFGITDIKRNPNDMDQVIITAQVLDTDGKADTSAKIAAGVTVELTGVEVDSVTLTDATETVDFEIALDDVTSGKSITVKATNETTND